MPIPDKWLSQEVVELEENHKKAGAWAKRSGRVVLAQTEKAPCFATEACRYAAKGGGQMIHLSNLGLLLGCTLHSLAPPKGRLQSQSQAAAPRWEPSL